jgi:hypothetical protein
MNEYMLKEIDRIPIMSSPLVPHGEIWAVYNGRIELKWIDLKP